MWPPLDLSQTLDMSLKIVGARWRMLAGAMLVAVVPVQVATVLLIVATTDSYKVTSSPLGAQSDGGGLPLATSTAILVVTLLGNLVGVVACYRAVSDVYLGRETNARAALRFAVARLGDSLWLTIVLILGLAVALLALILPAVWLAVAWWVAFPALLLEDRRGPAALGRSYRLVEGRWWVTFGRLLVAGVLALFVGGLASELIMGPTRALVDDTSFAALAMGSVADLVMAVITTPFIAAVGTLVFFDLRARKEGVAPDGTRSASTHAPPPAPPRTDERDAFGNPVAPPAPPVPERPADLGPDAAAPPGWAPPVPPEARPRPLWDPLPDGDRDRE